MVPMHTEVDGIVCAREKHVVFFYFFFITKETIFWYIRRVNDNIKTTTYGTHETRRIPAAHRNRNDRTRGYRVRRTRQNYLFYRARQEYNAHRLSIEKKKNRKIPRVPLGVTVAVFIIGRVFDQQNGVPDVRVGRVDERTVLDDGSFRRSGRL